MTQLLEVENLAVGVPVRSAILRRTVGTIHALRGISFSIAHGEILALVGESGSGKSTAARAIARLIRPSQGTIRFEGSDVSAATGEALRRIRRNMQMVFQDPFSSLNRRMRVDAIVSEPLRVHAIGSRSERAERVAGLLRSVGLANDVAHRYPVALSGGQRQRVAIARAIALNPKLIICDEPVSALDVPIQAQILSLLLEIKREHGTALLFITHDLGVARRLADRVAVMHGGQIVECAPTAELFTAPHHPYSRALLSAVARPSLDDRTRPRIRLAGHPPSPLAASAGCLFAPRCEFADPRCASEMPPLKPLGGARSIRCHHAIAGLPPWARPHHEKATGP